jgi:hypothetical protein
MNAILHTQIVVEEQGTLQEGPTVASKIFGHVLRVKWFSALIVGALVALGLGGAADALTLTVVDSLNTSNPFGVLFDGTNVWFSSGVGGSTLHQINQNAAGLPVTGVTRTLSGAGCCGAMAWDGTHFVSAASGTVGFFNAVTGAFVSSVGTSGGGGLIDGLDFDHNEIWYSPDVSAVFRFDSSGAPVGPNPVLPAAGGFSGVERIDVGANSFLIVVIDATSPRKLCKVTLAGAFDPVADCATLPNTRYEDLAFDGRFLYAADVFGNRLDKIDLAIDGGSIFQPPGPGGPQVPAPASLLLVGVGLIGLAAWQRRHQD